MSETPMPDDRLAPPEIDDAGEPLVEEGRPSRRSLWLAMGAVALALGLIWLAPGIEDFHPDEASDGAVAEYPGEPGDADATGKPAPLHFTLKDMNGADVQLASFKGKVILLNFWATWCGPCKAEIPSLVDREAQHYEIVAVLLLQLDE